MEHSGRRGNHFVCPGFNPAARANRLERLGLFFDDRSCAAAFGLSQAKNGAEVRQNGAEGISDIEVKFAAATEQAGTRASFNGAARDASDTEGSEPQWHLSVHNNAAA